MADPPKPPEVRVRPLLVVPWIDPAMRHGFDLQHPYVELCWTPVLGPTATLAARRLDLLLRDEPRGVDVDVPDLGRQLGVSPHGRAGRWSPIVRALERLERYGFARWDPHTDRFALRQTVAAVSPRLLERLPETTVRLHHRLTDLHLGRSRPTTGCPDVARPATSASPPDVRPPSVTAARAKLRSIPGGADRPGVSR